MNLPYQNMNRSMEFAYDDNNNPLLIEAFIELANNKKILPEDFLKLKLKSMNLKRTGNNILLAYKNLYKNDGQEQIETIIYLMF